MRLGGNWIPVTFPINLLFQFQLGAIGSSEGVDFAKADLKFQFQLGAIGRKYLIGSLIVPQ